MNKHFMSLLVAYLLWAVNPAYWKLLSGVDTLYILFCRIVFALLFGLVLVCIKKEWKQVKAVFTNKKKLITAIGASLCITFNWGMFILLVNSGRVLETSLAYYINPMLFVIFGLIFFREKLKPLQIGAIILAAAGVIYSAVSYGHFPYMALLLAITFGGYGTLQKVLNVSPTVSFFVETLIVSPFALALLLYYDFTGIGGFATGTTSEIIFLVLGGVATGLPMIIYADGVNYMPLTTVGVMQFIAPTGMFLLGIFAYGEAFSTAQLITFAFIWAGVVLYLIANFTSKNKKVPQEMKL